MNWFRALKSYQQNLVFFGLLISIGTTGMSIIAFVERRSGLIAENFNFARSTDFQAVSNDLKAWQLYSDIRRLTRAIYDVEGPMKITPVEEKSRELLADYKQQLTIVQAEYDKVTKKK